jgi:hypothetical protein
LFGLGGACLAFAAFALIAGLSTLRPEEPVNELASILLLGAGFGLSGALMLMAGVLEVVCIGPTAIEARNWFGRWGLIEWESIERVRFSPVSGYLTLHGRHGARVRVSALLKGSGAFIVSLRSRMDLAVDLHALDAFDW